MDRVGAWRRFCGRPATDRCSSWLSFTRFPFRQLRFPSAGRRPDEFRWLSDLQRGFCRQPASWSAVQAASQLWIRQGSRASSTFSASEGGSCSSDQKSLTSATAPRDYRCQSHLNSRCSTQTSPLFHWNAVPLPILICNQGAILSK